MVEVVEHWKRVEEVVAEHWKRVAEEVVGLWMMAEEAAEGHWMKAMGEEVARLTRPLEAEEEHVLRATEVVRVRS
jgi:hypothetical protein